MTALWIAAGALALALAAAAFVVFPLLRAGRVVPSEAEHAVSIYRDQLDALARDRRAGLIGPDGHAAAERALAQRAGRAARALDGSVIVSRRAPGAALAAAVAIAGGAVGLYAVLGNPAAPDAPLAARLEAEQERRLAAAEPDAVAAEALERLEAMPDGFEKFWAEAQAYAARGDYASAAGACRNAADAAGGDPAVEAAYAEALTLANGNKVPPAARLTFAQVLARDPREPRARYYLALAKAQAQDFEAAMRDWQALLADSAPGAPWLPLVRRDLVNMARFTGTDIDAVLPDAKAAERARAGGAASDPAMRIAEIEAIGAAERGHELWLELIRLQAAADPDAAGETLAAARARLAAAPFVLRMLDEAAAEAGLAPDRRGPDEAAVAAAAGMTEAERNDMVEGMVSCLAARLEQDPADLEGWAMLIRSYAVLDQPESAREALRSALAAFPEKGAVADRLRRTAAEFAIGLD